MAGCPLPSKCMFVYLFVRTFVYTRASLAEKIYKEGELGVWV